MASKEDSYRAKEHPKFENPRNALGAGTLAHQRSSPRGFMESRANGGNKGRVRRDFAYFSFSRHAIGLFGASAGGGAAAWFGGSGSARAYPLWPVRTRGRRPNSVIDPSDKRQRIMILMSDTGGGHRASAEALKAGFRSVFGDKHRIDIVDLWTDHTPWPFHEFPKSYSFMVHHPWIWRFNFTMTQPQFVHIPLATFGTLLMGSRISAAFDKYKPNLIVSVHPLMQHVPVRVLRQRIAAGIQVRREELLCDGMVSWVSCCPVNAIVRYSSHDAETSEIFPCVVVLVCCFGGQEVWLSLGGRESARQKKKLWTA